MRFRNRCVKSQNHPSSIVIRISEKVHAFHLILSKVSRSAPVSRDTSAHFRSWFHEVAFIHTLTANMLVQLCKSQPSTITTPNGETKMIVFAEVSGTNPSGSLPAISTQVFFTKLVCCIQVTRIAGLYQVGISNDGMYQTRMFCFPLISRLFPKWLYQVN